MSLKTYKSYTKSTRGTVLVDRKNLWKGKSLKSLTVGQSSTGGRNNLGRITSRRRGGGGQRHRRRNGGRRGRRPGRGVRRRSPPPILSGFWIHFVLVKITQLSA